MAVVGVVVLNDGYRSKIFWFEDIGFVNVVAGFLDDLVFGPEEFCGAEGIGFLGATAEGVVLVGKGLVAFFYLDGLIV